MDTYDINEALKTLLDAYETISDYTWSAQGKIYAKLKEVLEMHEDYYNLTEDENYNRQDVFGH